MKLDIHSCESNGEILAELMLQVRREELNEDDFLKLGSVNVEGFGTEQYIPQQKFEIGRVNSVSSVNLMVKLFGFFH